ncbi:MAG: hypothetical protein K5893_00660 [Prevotella sp.]|nr:hypothetical protein [Prevotella sp.]
MSKTIQLQIDKSRTLLEGLRQNLGELKAHGMSENDLQTMEKELGQLAEINEQCDAIRADLSQKVKHMNGILDGVKRSFVEKKKVIKVNYPQEEWAKYGVLDKR